MANDFGAFATDNLGIFRIGAMDCDEFGAICDKEKVASFPTVRVYPPFPAPTSDLDLSNNFDAKKLKSAAGRFIEDKAIEVTSNNHKLFVEENPGTPKVLLFTNAKKGTPFIYKALSQAFEKTLQFGIVRESEDALVKQYKVKTFPSLFVVKNEGKPLKYEGKEFTYNGIFEFINIHS
jgi:hypothetical protein